MSLDFDESHSDGVHEIHYDIDAHQFEGVAKPDWESVFHNVDGEPIEEATVTWSDMSAAFVLILEWILKGHTLSLAGARAASLAVYLDPTHNSKFGSNLAQIALEANCTKAALSKALMDFRDDAGIMLSAGKSQGARATYQNVQRRLVHEHKHSSDIKAAKKLAGA
jgi:hypothetical protein